MEPTHARLPDLMGRRRGRSAARSRSQAEPRLGQPERLLVATRTRAPARILVVDDREDVRELLVVVLSGADRVVDAAGNGTEALRWLERDRYDLVVSDLKMPELDGPGCTGPCSGAGRTTTRRSSLSRGSRTRRSTRAS